MLGGNHMTYQQELNAPTAERRLAAVQALVREMTPIVQMQEYVNNHIHTFYSFSPYSPSAAAYTAWQQGLTTAGIMDHDSVSGAEEFIRAAELLGIGATVGFECRCRMDGTPFEGCRTNNPDQKSVAYVACHGIPHQNIVKAQEWLAPFREKRNTRNRRMVEKINRLLQGSGVTLHFDQDVVPLSRAAEGGSITERHILYALALQIMAYCGKGEPVLAFLQGKLAMALPEKQQALLRNINTSDYAYYLLGALKAELVEQFYIDAGDECPHISEFVAFVQKIGAISAYAYLGDVKDSATGDKKNQQFEDAYIDRLVPWLKEAGFCSVTFMPTRNSETQLAYLMQLCEANELFQISGEDINSPFQSFVCSALDHPRYQHLITSTWALIGHELAATQDVENGMFGRKTLAAMPALGQRVAHFAAFAKHQKGAIR